MPGEDSVSISGVAQGTLQGLPHTVHLASQGTRPGPMEAWGCPQGGGRWGYLVGPTLGAVQGRVQLGLAGGVSFHQAPQASAHQVLWTREGR